MKKNKTHSEDEEYDIKSESEIDSSKDNNIVDAVLDIAQGQQEKDVY